VETENWQEIELKKIADEVLQMHPTRKTLIFSLQSLLCQFEYHLDNIIKRYKMMTITILLATGVAVGFSFSSELKDLQVNKLLMSSTACIFGVIVITALWHLDIQVFHKFWGAFFVEEVKMEKMHPFLVDIEKISVTLDNVKVRLLGDGKFYIFFNTILLITAGTFLSFLSDSKEIKILIFSFIGLLIFFMIKMMNNACKKLQNALDSLLAEQDEAK
jgi:hypothetical protein